jgi:A118 family predicted phage portal protein
MQWLANLGYENVDEHPMNKQVDTWWSWLTATADFYKSQHKSGKKRFKVERISIHPAKMVAEDWASLLFNEKTEIGCEGTGLDAAQAWLEEWLATSRFIEGMGNRAIERCMALGTAAWALKLKDINIDGTANPSAKIALQRFDARNITPLTFDEDECTECMFTSSTTMRGKELKQVQVYRLSDSGTYEINTAIFDGDEQVERPGIAAMVDTRITTPPFALLRPGIDNTYWENSPFGVSVFDRALGAVQLVDMAVDNMNRDIYTGQKMVFLPIDMLESDTKGNYIIPREEMQQYFVKFENTRIGESNNPVFEYNPDLRIADNRMAIKTGLELLGRRSGLGKSFYSLDDRATVQPKTATEVSADSAELLRSAKKHEQSILPAIETICTAACQLANTFQGTSLPDITGRVSVVFGDNIIEDDSVVRQRDREDVSAGLLAGWRYIAKWEALDDTTAKERFAEAQGETLADEE